MHQTRASCAYVRKLYVASISGDHRGGVRSDASAGFAGSMCHMRLATAKPIASCMYIVYSGPEEVVSFF